MRRENRKPSPVCETEDGGGEQIALQGFGLPEQNHITGNAEKQGHIAPLLPSGSAQAVSLRQLADITGLSTREVRRSIQRERMNGAAICEAGAGYFLAETDEERRRWVRSMRGRARQILRAARAVERGGALD